MDSWFRPDAVGLRTCDAWIDGYPHCGGGFRRCNTVLIVLAVIQERFAHRIVEW